MSGIRIVPDVCNDSQNRVANNGRIFNFVRWRKEGAQTGMSEPGRTCLRACFWALRQCWRDYIRKGLHWWIPFNSAQNWYSDDWVLLSFPICSTSTQQLIFQQLLQLHQRQQQLLRVQRPVLSAPALSSGHSFSHLTERSKFLEPRHLKAAQHACRIISVLLSNETI